MAVKIRLTRKGAKGKPFYRIVVANSESPRDGRFLEIVGHYDPLKNPPEITLQEGRIADWISKGAKPTLTVSQLLAKKVVPAVA
ncbi:MAG: 30S ribosomal protein S16 [Syntrophales bacterium]